MAALGMAVAVEVGHDFFLQLVLVRRVDDAVGVAALQVEVDVNTAVGHSGGLLPINIIEMCIRDRRHPLHRRHPGQPRLQGQQPAHHL